MLAVLNRKWPSKLIAYVLMPDHLHLIANPRDGRIKEFSGALKSLAANRIIEVEHRFDFLRSGGPDSDGSTHQVWQESFKAMPLWSGWMIWQTINYIHANPVRAKLVSSSKDYPWSSFRAFYQDSAEPLLIDQDWWWPDELTVRKGGLPPPVFCPYQNSASLWRSTPASSVPVASHQER